MVESNSRSSQHGRLYMPTLIAGIAFGSLGLLITRPIVCTGGIQLPHAEIIQFPYPIATATFQFWIIWLVLHVGGLIAICMQWTRGVAEGLNRAGYVVVDVEEGKTVDAGTFEAGDHTLLSRFLLGIASFFRRALSIYVQAAKPSRLLPLAGIIALEAISSTYLLSHIPLRISRLSAALAILFVIFWKGLMGFELAHVQKCLKPLFLIFFAGLLSSYDGDVWISWKTLGVICLSAIAKSGWPILIDWNRSVEGELQEKDDQTLEQRKRILTAAKERDDRGVVLEETWKLLCCISTLVLMALLITLWISGEISQILRNFYFLDDTRFWIYMAIGAASRLALFISSVFLLLEMSVSTGRFYGFDVVFIIGLLNIFLMAILIPNPKVVQKLGISGVALGAVWFSTCSTEYSPGPALRAKFHDISTIPGPRQRRYLALFALLVVLLTGYNLATRVSTTLIIEISAMNPIPSDFPVLPGKDSYLAPRPSIEFSLDIANLLKNCNSTSKQEGCLEYLSIGSLPDSKNEAKRRLPMPDKSTIEAPIQPPDTFTQFTSPSISNCSGSVLYYHLHISGPPSTHHLLSIKSWLHTQDLACSHLYIWSTLNNIEDFAPVYKQDPVFKQIGQTLRRPYFHEHVTFKVFHFPQRIPVKVDPRVQSSYLDPANCQRTMSGEKPLRDGIVRDNTDGVWNEWFAVPEDSQVQFYEETQQSFMRWTVLHVYGGVWVDASFVFLQDWRPSMGGGKAILQSNLIEADSFDASVVAMPANSTLTTAILSLGINAGMNFHPQALSKMLDKEQLFANGTEAVGKIALLNPVIFSPGRQTEAHEETEGKEKSLEKFYPGVLAFRLQEKETEAGIDKSWVEIVKKEHDAFFSGQRTNPYGEKWEGPLIPRYLL